MNIVLLIILAASLIAILFFSSRISWRFYQATDKTNRLMLRIFTGGMAFLVIAPFFAAAAGLTPNKAPALMSLMLIVGLMTMGALCTLVGRELWSVYQRARLIMAVNTLAETNEE